MQPYLFPYIGYWQLINHVDKFVVYDNIQFSKKGWFHRNNILLNKKKTLFTIPLKKDSDYLDVVERYLAHDSEKPINKIVNQIENGYRKAPFFKEVMPLIRECFKYDDKNLFRYILNSINEILKLLEINTEVIVSSTIAIDHSFKAEEKVMAICKALQADEYVNPVGGTELYDTGTFANNGIKLSFLESELPEYKQFADDFIPYLSIIDALMFSDLGEVKSSLSKFELIEV